MITRVMEVHTTPLKSISMNYDPIILFLRFCKYSFNERLIHSSSWPRYVNENTSLAFLGCNLFSK
jgi:hypothetical protein